MKLYLNDNAFRYELEHTVRIFETEVETAKEPFRRAAAGEKGDYVRFRVSLTKHRARLSVAVRVDGKVSAKTKRLPAGMEKREYERETAVMFYDLMSAVSGKRPEWGVMTGVRPAKFARILLDGGVSAEEITDAMCRDYRVSRAKAELSVKTASAARRVAADCGERDYSLYVSIPFCPTRCEYCSFVSKAVGREAGFLTAYLEKLKDELIFTAAAADKLNLKLQSVYIGGGTPTVLDENELRALLEVISECFPVKSAAEYTVEAGRPDTVTGGKLGVMSEHGITRISINPQTFNDGVLKTIGRRHSSEDVYAAFDAAKRAGFENINADLIAGLRTDTNGSFCLSLKKLMSLEPKSVTVHALTLKRASAMRECGRGYSGDVGGMLGFAYRELTGSGYMPYYMYKQKGAAENLENVGYAQKGYEGLYNIFIMDELHTVLACGAGGVTKLKNRGTGRIERIFGYKYPREYINGFGEVIRRKEGIAQFYEYGE